MYINQISPSILVGLFGLSPMTGEKIRFERILHWWLKDLGHCVLQSTNTQHAVQTSRGAST